ncbi:unnamed protein product [Blepharisma stoltei]|uniref:F-box domain-containing protein n=1 Tax=Blepharisma stoltei TaxID=1481888 RepID=A0AAU9JP13_9CILI|nr:unnamed protein product [Blepharisma stoltei]
MENRLAIDKLGINILDQITDFLAPLEIVSIFGINRSFHKLWNSKIQQKIFQAFPDFTLQMDPREKWLHLQIRVTCQNKNYPKITKMTSDNKIYVLDISFTPEPEIKLFTDGQINLWKPESPNKKNIKCSNISELEYPIQACGYEDNHLALLLENGKVKHIYNNVEVNDFQVRGINYEKITQMFFLLKCSRLVMQCSKKIVFMDYNGNISLNMKLGLMEKYKVVPWANDAFITVINENLLYIDDTWGRKLLCNYSGPALKRTPDFWIDEESKKYVFQTGKKNSGWAKKVNANWIDFVEKGTKMFRTKDHHYILIDRYTLIDECCSHQYKITQDLENVLQNGVYILTHCISPQNNQLIQLFIEGETNHIALKWLPYNINILSFAFPYIVYSAALEEGDFEIGILKF